MDARDNFEEKLESENAKILISCNDDGNEFEESRREEKLDRTYTISLNALGKNYPLQCHRRYPTETGNRYSLRSSTGDMSQE